MFPQQPQQQFSKAGADVQLFYRDSAWAKPPGVSHIYMMLIGGGGDGNGVDEGGSSGAVTVWYGAAQHVPDSLVLAVSTGNNVNTTVNYRASNGLNTLLTASASNGSTTATAMTANQFTASGFFSSTAGQTQGSGSASTTTFLTAGASVGASPGNYGYTRGGTTSHGYFQLQPIIVSVGSGGDLGVNSRAAIGSGAGVIGRGGPGMVLIASW